jgi:non-lysosomal glucosylceramidase
MTKQTGVNRRQFLTTTSAAMGIAAFSGGSLSGEDAGSSKTARSAICNPQGARETCGPLRSYAGASAGEAAFPLGGIGTGTVSLGARGELRDWEIFNRPAKRRILPSTFVALWAKAEGDRPLLRVVEGPPQPPFRGWNGYSHESGQGLPHFQRATLSGKYPIAAVDFEDRALPVTVSLNAFTPFVPLNVDDSSLPAVIFQYCITNRSQKPAEVSLSFSLLNAVGYDGKTFLEDNEHPGFGKNVNTFRQEQASGIKIAGLDLTSEKYAPGDPRHGSMALMTTHPSFTKRTSCVEDEWWDCNQTWVEEFSASGKFQDSAASEATPDGTTGYGTLAPYARLASGESITITFILAWHFPVRENYWHYKDEQVRGRKLTNYYGTRFKSAWEVALHTASRLPELERKTRLFVDTFFSSTLPPEVLEAVSSQASILRTNTCILLEGKQFFGFEGCGDDEAMGWMNCSHVWNYEHALAFLFPELERSMRDTDFLHEVRADDSMAFRAILPLDIKQSDYRPAADGQMGCILKLYREWQISGDDAFLKKMWPNAKRALEFAWKFWDADKDGVMEGEQHNTYDIELFGPNPMMTSLYLAALRAGELMAGAVGDSRAAATYLEIRERGARNFESMWNGEFYIQKTTAVDDIRPMPPYDGDKWKDRVVQEGQLKYQIGEGCLSDQMLGQWYADVLGLDIGLPPERVRKALQAVYRHNFKQNFWDRPNTQRIYAINDEQGLLLCSWPNGGRPTLPLVYGDEVWTGIEYQVAAHLIYRGLIEEGLNIVKGISGRYDGARRNPWNQIEWGNHYSRAMASYSVMLALSGFRCSAVEQKLTFEPCIHSEDFRCFFAAGSGWGVYSQDSKAGALTTKIECRYGDLTLRCLVLGAGPNKKTFDKSTLAGPSGKQLPCSVKSLNGRHEIEFREKLVLREGESATTILT